MDALFDRGGVAGRLRGLAEAMRRGDEDEAFPAEPTPAAGPIARGEPTDAESHRDGERDASGGAVAAAEAVAGPGSPPPASASPPQRRGRGPAAVPESPGPPSLPAAHLRQLQSHFETMATRRDQQEHLRIARQLLAEQQSLREALANRGQSEFTWGA